MLRPMMDYETSPARLNRQDYLALLEEARLIRAAAAAEAIATLRRLAKGLVSGLVEAHRRRKAFAELNGLDDRMLRDLGLSRGELWSAVDGKVDFGPSNDNLRKAGAANENKPRKGRAA